MHASHQGPPGSGKSSMAEVVAETMVENIDSRLNFMRCDGKKSSSRCVNRLHFSLFHLLLFCNRPYADDLGKIFRRFQKLNASLDPKKAEEITPKIILIDNFDR